MSEDARWLWIDEHGEHWEADDLEGEWIPRPAYRRYCPQCGQVVVVFRAGGEVSVPPHLVTGESGLYMTICEASRTERILEPAP